MNIIKFKKKIVNKKFWDEELMDVLLWKKTYLTKLSIRCKDRMEVINHPLVLTGQAYWYDDNNICIGYRLKTNKKIFIPVFNYNKQNVLNSIHNQINSY